MRLWVHKIWLKYNSCPLQTAGPKENKRFEELLHTYGETQTALAWLLYVSADPRPYHLEPQKIAVEVMTKDGRKFINEAENEKAITRFPLSAFLAVSEGYIVAAGLKQNENGNFILPSGQCEIFRDAMKPSPGVAKSWNVPNTSDEEE